MRRVAVIALLAAIGLLPAAAAAHAPRANLATMEQMFMCVTCKIPLPEAVSPQAAEEDAEIARLIGQGDTASQIRSVMVSQYGDEVLAAPPDSGFNVVVYVGPLVAVALLALLTAVLLPRWRRRRASGTAATGGPPISDADAARLAVDLARYDP